MANTKFRDALNKIVFGKASGVGSDDSPFIPMADVPTATPTVYNVTLTLAVTEYSQAMPANCRRITWQCRTAFDVIYAFVTGKVAGPTAPYMTLKAARAYDSGVINQGASPSTLYLASATAGVVVEIEVWA